MSINLNFYNLKRFTIFNHTLVKSDDPGLMHYDLVILSFFEATERQVIFSVRYCFILKRPPRSIENTVLYKTLPIF